MNHNLILLMLLGPILAQKCPQWNLKELVSISPLILEASLVSHGQISNQNQLSVTFKVRKVVKNSENGKFSQKYLRMTFEGLSKKGLNTQRSPRSDECQKTLPALYSKQKYLIFAKNSRLFGFEPIVSPLRKSRRAKMALEKALCSNQHSQYCHKGNMQLF